MCVIFLVVTRHYASTTTVHTVSVPRALASNVFAGITSSQCREATQALQAVLEVSEHAWGVAGRGVLDNEGAAHDDRRDIMPRCVIEVRKNSRH